METATRDRLSREEIELRDQLATNAFNMKILRTSIRKSWLYNLSFNGLIAVILTAASMMLILLGGRIVFTMELPHTYVLVSWFTVQSLVVLVIFDCIETFTIRPTKKQSLAELRDELCKLLDAHQDCLDRLGKFEYTPSKSQQPGRRYGQLLAVWEELVGNPSSYTTDEFGDEQ